MPEIAHVELAGPILGVEHRLETNGIGVVLAVGESIPIGDAVAYAGYACGRRAVVPFVRCSLGCQGKR